MQAVRVQSARDVDEIVLLDVTASKQGRLVDLRLVQEVVRFLRVPLSVGGGIRSVEDVAELLKLGADKVVLGGAAFLEENLVSRLSDRFGAQAIVVSVDAVADDAERVAILSGEMEVDIGPVQYASEMVRRGAGEILLQNVSRDGTMSGMGVSNISAVCAVSPVPVMASSGLASAQDAVSAARAGAAAILAGAALQFTETTPKIIKEALEAEGFSVRK